MRGLVVIMALAACGEDTGGGPYTSIDMFDASLKDAQCEHLVRCGQFPDKATCAKYAILSNLSVTATPQVEAAVLAGKIYYSGTNIAACVAAIAATTCDTTDQDSRSVPKACDAIFRGAVGAGAACTFNTECISDVCNLACGDANTCCTGTCVGDTPPVMVPLAQIGSSCVAKGCVEGSFCSSNLQLCTALLSANMPCSSPGQCAYGLSCFGATMLTCRPLPALGEPCPDGMCRDEGQHCKLPPTGGAAVCTANGLPGAACGFSTDCSPYYRCDSPTMKCAEQPAVGASCVGTGTCADSALNYCDNNTELCKAKEPIGTPCTFSQECASETCTGTCAKPEACI